MADNSNTTKSKLLFMLSSIVLDYFHERIVINIVVPIIFRA